MTDCTEPQNFKGLTPSKMNLSKTCSSRMIVKNYSCMFLRIKIF
jgi:hypothetical protein